MYNEAIASHKNAANAGPQWKWTLAHTNAVANREKEEVLKIIEELEADPKPIETWGLLKSTQHWVIRTKLLNGWKKDTKCVLAGCPGLRGIRIINPF